MSTRRGPTGTRSSSASKMRSRPAWPATSSTKAIPLAGISPRTSVRWILPDANPGHAAELARALNLSPLAARVLAHRGLADPEAARRFLQPGFDDLFDALALRDMPTAVERLARAIRDRERILIYGDYD